ncbi:IS2 repressor TnpA [Thermoplasmatales archaeon]|nr:IS2 repressor TnpA [Thermoplasmatales archaeon]
MNSKHSTEEKLQIVMESLMDNVSQAEICRRHGIYPVQLIRWKEQFIQGGKTALAQRRSSDSRDEEIADLKKIIGDQSLVIDAFKKRLQGRSK